MTNAEKLHTTDPSVELSRCAESFKYFCETYLTLNRQANLHVFQDRYVDTIQAYRNVALLKFRNCGFTTLTAFYKLWTALFQSDRRILWLSPSDREAVGVCQLLRNQINRLPEWLVGGTTRFNDHEVQFSRTGSRITFMTITSQGFRGFNVTDLIIDEAAYVKDMQQCWNCVAPCVMDGRVIVLSSAKALKKGEYNWFRELIKEAREEENLFHFFQSHWYENPESTEEWADNLRASLSDKGWAIELESEFVVEEDVVEPRPLDTNPQVLSGGFRIIHRENCEPILVERKSDTRFFPKVPTPVYEPIDLGVDAETIDLNKTQVDPVTRSNIIESLKKCPIDVEHPKFYEDEELLSNIDHIWNDIAKVMPNVKIPEDAAEDKSTDFTSVSVDILRIAGVINDAGNLPIDMDYRAELTKKIKKGLPAQMELDMDGPAMRVNGIPTKINARAMESAVVGLAELHSVDFAIETVSRLVRRKLQRLF